MTRPLRPVPFALLVTLLAGCGRHAGSLMPAGWRYASPPAPVVGQQAMVVTEHPLSSEVGAEILRRGGNAIDAAVAVGFAQAVVNPRAGNIGGGGFLVYRRANGEAYAR